MKKSLISFLLCFLIIITSLAAGGAARADSVCFIAVNDTLLDLSSAPTSIGGVTYVPISVFSNFWIGYTYSSDASSALLSTGGRSLVFDLENGTCVDQNGTEIKASASYRYGQMFVPVSYVCSYFGLVYEYLSGSGHGDVVRITDSNAVLSGSSFMEAAKNLMEQRYNQYLGQSQTPTPTPTVPPTREGTYVYLSFEGAPSVELVDILDEKGLPATFFLTGSEMRDNPELLRRIAGSGYGVGIFCATFDDYSETAALLFEIARVKTLLITSHIYEEEKAKEMATEHSLVYWGYDIDAVNQGSGVSNPYVVTSLINSKTERADVRFSVSENTLQSLPVVLLFLQESRFSVTALREINPY